MRRWFLVLIAFAISAFLAPEASAKPIPGRYIVVLDETVDHPGVVAAKHERKYDAESHGVYRNALTGYVADVPATELAALRSDRTVRFITKDRVSAQPSEQTGSAPRCLEPRGSLSDMQCMPEGVDRIDGDTSTARSGDARGSEGVNVAIIDSGLALDHPDLNVAGGVDCTTGSPIADPARYDDFFGHGSFVGGVVGAKDNRIGVVGVAPGTPLWAVRVVGDGEVITDSALICGVDWVTSTRTDNNRTNDIAVANMSITGHHGDADSDCGRASRDALHLAFCRSTAAGTTHVVAAGNEDRDFKIQAPPVYSEVLTVTAMADFDGKPGGIAEPDCYGTDYGQVFGDFDDQAAPFSNYATKPAEIAHVIAAPGDCITSTVPGGYGHSDGTSFSSPHVAGTAALCIARRACTGGAKKTMAKLLADAKAYNLAHPDYGFLGDPIRPVAGKYYGYLIRAGLY
jgi:subtilisin